MVMNEYKRRALRAVGLRASAAAPRIKEAAERRARLLANEFPPRYVVRQISEAMDLHPDTVRDYLHRYDRAPAMYDQLGDGWAELADKEKRK